LIIEWEPAIQENTRKLLFSRWEGPHSQDLVASVFGKDRTPLIPKLNALTSSIQRALWNRQSLWMPSIRKLEILASNCMEFRWSIKDNINSIGIAHDSRFACVGPILSLKPMPLSSKKLESRWRNILANPICGMAFSGHANSESCHSRKLLEKPLKSGLCSSRIRAEEAAAAVPSNLGYRSAWETALGKFHSGPSSHNALVGFRSTLA